MMENNQNNTQNTTPKQPSESWNNVGKPIVVLACICTVVSGSLAAVNQVTAPRIADRASQLADQTRFELMPDAPGFNELDFDVSNVTEIYEVTDGSGYVITAAAKGFNGDVTVIVAFDQDGTITRVKVQEHAETIGIGDKVELEEFWGQFTGKPAEKLTLNTDIDKMTGATISSGAVTSAVNAAIEAYLVASSGGEYVSVDTDDGDSADDIDYLSVATNLVADVEFEVISVEDPYVLAVYEEKNGKGFVVFTEVDGYGGKIRAAVSFDTAGAVTGVEILSHTETVGIGDQIEGADYREKFVGVTSKDASEKVDTISGATVSSKATIQAVNAAIRGYQAANGLEVDEIPDPNALTEDEIKALRGEWRTEMMPYAPSFLVVATGMDNVVESYRAVDGSGYVITTMGQGYSDLTPIMVALNSKGEVTQVREFNPQPSEYDVDFLENEEFFGQFNGQTAATDFDTVDVVSGATASSSAVHEAVNLAIEAFHVSEEIFASDDEFRDGMRAEMMPDVEEFIRIEVKIENILDVYKASDDSGYIISAIGAGYNKFTPILVALDDKGIVTQVREFRLGGSKYRLVYEDFADFLDQFIGQTKEITWDEVDQDTVSGATASGEAVHEAVNRAIDTFHILKEMEAEEVVNAKIRGEWREDMMPKAKGFTQVELSMKNVVEVFKADGDSGYVITALGQGFSSLTPVMIALDSDGIVLEVREFNPDPSPYHVDFLGNDAFFGQFKGQEEEIDFAEVDTISGSTASCSAIHEAVNLALAAFATIS